MQIDPAWAFVADTVMGGVSSGRVDRAVEGGLTVSRLTGEVSLENNGGFIQMAADLDPAFDLARFDGFALRVRGNGETYDLRLKTSDLTRPWQSFRQDFEAPHAWTDLVFRFDAFKPYRTSSVFLPDRLRRIGIVAVGREFGADVSVAGLKFF